MNKEQKKGSKTAKDGFLNEDFVVKCFNEWKDNKMSQEWLISMNYTLNEIEYVKAEKIKGSFKADVQVEIRVSIKLKKLIDIQNIQVKLVSNLQGFNQIDKRWLSKYSELWSINEVVLELLKYFTGELKPIISNARNKKRMFMDEFSEEQQKLVVGFFEANKILVVSDILKGRGTFAAEWMLVILKIKTEEIKWVIRPINIVLNHFGNGDIKITPQGNLKIGKIGMQRKGGDGGRVTANMLQFKINPCELFNCSHSPTH